MHCVNYWKYPCGWHKEYNGYIMAGCHSQEGNNMYHCMDESLEQVKSSGACEDVHHLHTVDTDSVDK